MDRSTGFLTTLVLIQVFLYSAYGVEKDDGSTLTKVSQKTPDFEFTTLDGRTLKSEELQGKVVYLHFIATWCGSCLKELPVIEEKVWQAFKDDPNFAMVVVGREHTKDEMETFKDKQDYSFPYAPDPGREMYTRFATKWVPRHYVIGPAGTIVHQGFGNEEEEHEAMVEAIRKELKKIEL
jgi:peroxiredoxin